MNRVVLAILGVVVAVAVIVIVARQGPDYVPPPPVVDAAPVDATLADGEVAVQELFLDDAGERKTVRVQHPNPEVQKKLLAWLEPQEKSAYAEHAALDCHAQVARTRIVSLTCAWVPLGPIGAPDAGAPDATPAAAADAAAQPLVTYRSLTLGIDRNGPKQLAWKDVLADGIGKEQVVEACKKVADPPTPCEFEWVPSSFAIGPNGTVFLCNGSNCVDIDGDAQLLKPELR